MRPGAYSFDLNTSGAAYEFQYNINSDETNLDVLDKLARLVNSSSLGITAEILSDGNGSSALKLTSIQTGLADNETELFSIAPDASTGSTEIMDQLGIDRITSPAQSSAFTLNGTSHSSLTNTFSINQVFELTLNQPTDSEKVNIGFKTDADALRTISSLWWMPIIPYSPPQPCMQTPMPVPETNFRQRFFPYPVRAGVLYRRSVWSRTRTAPSLLIKKRSVKQLFRNVIRIHLKLYPNFGIPSEKKRKISPSIR